MISVSKALSSSQLQHSLYTNFVCSSLSQIQHRLHKILYRSTVKSSAAESTHHEHARCYSQLGTTALLWTMLDAGESSGTLAKERYWSFTLSALSKVFTTYLLMAKLIQTEVVCEATGE